MSTDKSIHVVPPNSVVVVVVVVASEPRVQSLLGPAAATGVPAEGVQRLANKDAF